MKCSYGWLPIDQHHKIEGKKKFFKKKTLLRKEGFIKLGFIKPLKTLQVKLSHWVSIKSMLQMLAWGWSVHQQSIKWCLLNSIISGDGREQQNSSSSRALNLLARFGHKGYYYYCTHTHTSFSPTKPKFCSLAFAARTRQVSWKP